jgi:6,7-dimethyl-8-ribityllumazine synthase
VVAARWNRQVTDRLLDGALRALGEVGIDPGDPLRCRVLWVPGAFELALGALKLIEADRVDAVVALGCVIRGETDHYSYVASAAASGIQRVSLDTGVPVSFGVLTTDDFAQALARSEETPESNKGFEAALTAVEMAVLSRRIGKG